MRRRILMVPFVIAVGLLVQPAQADDSCLYAFDGACDEPQFCAADTDSTDCGAGAALEAPAAVEEEPWDSSMLSGFDTSLSSYWFVFLGIAAFVLFRARAFPGRVPLLLGLGGMAAPGLLIFLAPVLGSWTFDLYQTIRGIDVLSAVLILLGVWLLVSDRRSAAITALATAREETSAIARNDSNSVSRAEQVRDALYDEVQRQVLAEDVPARVYKSTPHSPDVWVRVESYNPLDRDPALVLRSSVTVVAVPCEFRRFDPELSVVVSDGKRERRYSGIIQLRDADVTELIRYLAGRKNRLRFKPPRVRRFPLQWTRPRNRLVGIEERDWEALLMLNLGWLLPPLLVWWLWGRARQRPLSLTSGKPSEEPRQLLRLDSWQTVLNGLAPYADKIRSELVTELSPLRGSVAPADGFGAELSVEKEDIWYEGVDGKVEREQIVVRLRRGIAFVHVYPYSGDLYVGWDAHVNAGTWVEAKVAEGRRSGESVRAYGIRAGWHSPIEYDVVDANFVTEHVHASVTRIVKRALRDHEIDQEVDFQIVRESRQSVIGRADPATKEKKRPFARVS